LKPQVLWLRVFIEGVVIVFFGCHIAVPMGASAQLTEWSVVNIAHRGGIVRGYPENTLAAFQRAALLLVDVIEIDLRGTRDGEVVIMHDETVDRTTDGNGRVSSFTLAELKRLDAGGGEPVPTYVEALDLIADTGVKLLLDVKVSSVLDKRAVVRITEQHGAVLDVIVGVRTLDDLRQFQRLNPNLRTLGFVDGPEDIEEFVAAGVDIIRLWPEWIEADGNLIGEVQNSGTPVWVTAGDASRDVLEGLIHAGANGILSDFPEVMSALVGDNEADGAPMTARSIPWPAS